MSVIFNKLRNDMGSHSLADYPKECCGIITKDFLYIQAKNISTNPKVSFILDPICLLKNDNNIWGIFHSHPGDENPLPSEEDAKATVFDEYKFIVGFSGKFYIYWFDQKLSLLRYEPFEESHLK
jgi:proteasome lid subunit RPN8/RPN11